MSARKKVANVAVRLPEGYRLALTDYGRKSLTPEIEKMLTANVSLLPDLTLKAAPFDSQRAFLSMSSDLSEQLREIARERCTTVGILVYTLVSETVRPVKVPRKSVDLSSLGLPEMRAA